MALIIKDRVMESSTTTGTGAMTLAGAYTGFRSFSSVCSTNDTCYYLIEAVDSNGVPTGDWETGIGTYSAANTLTRTTVLASSNSGSAVSFAVGTKRVAISVIASILSPLAPMADGDLLANISGASAAPIANTLSAILDYVLGNAQGSIIQRGASAWQVLGPGTLGYVLTSGGASAGNSWAASSFSAASSADVQAGTSSTKAVTPSALSGSAAPQTLTDGATISWDMSQGYNAKVTLGGNRTLATPTNPVLGIDYSLAVIQDGTGSRTLTWPSCFDWGATGAPTLTTTASKVDQLIFRCTDASTPKFRAFLSGKGFS